MEAKAVQSHLRGELPVTDEHDDAGRPTRRRSDDIFGFGWCNCKVKSGRPTRRWSDDIFGFGWCSCWLAEAVNLAVDRMKW